MALPKLYKSFYDERIFSFHDVLKKFQEKKYSELYLRKRISDLMKAGYLGSVGARGIYYIIPQGLNKESFVPDKYLIASKLLKTGIIGYHSALELHGVSYSNYNTVYVITRNYFRSFEFQETKYQAISGVANFGIEMKQREGIKIPVTDRERTIIEGIDKLQYTGGLEEYFKSIELFPSINFDHFLLYLDKFNKKILYAKVGFLLSYYKQRWGFPIEYKKKFKSFLGKRVNYLSDKKEKTELVPEWKLMVPIRLKNLLEEH